MKLFKTKTGTVWHILRYSGPPEDDPDWDWVLSVVPKTDSKNYYYSTGVPCNYNEVRQSWAEARQDFWDSPVEDIPQILADFEDLANSIIAECE